MADALTERARQRERLIELAKSYVEGLSDRVVLSAAAVVGSVARGDFNVWSDIDVVVVAEDLPGRVPDRAAMLSEEAPPGLQPVGFTKQEFLRAWRKHNPLVREATEGGVVLVGDDFFRGVAGANGS